MEDGQPGFARNGGRIVSRNQQVAVRHDIPIRFVGAAQNEFVEFSGRTGAMMKALPGTARVEPAEHAKHCHRDPPAGGVRKANSPRPRMPDEAADQDEPSGLESRCGSSLLLAMEKGPRNLRGEGFAENPTGVDAVFQQRGFDGGGVIVQRPVRLMRIGGLDETCAVVQRMAEGREESPITVKAGQMNQRGFADGTVETKLEMFAFRDGGGVMRNA